MTRRVLSRLECAELSELNPHLRDDLRIAWIVTLYAAEGNPQPLVSASYRVLGMHPDKVWPWIVAWRKAKLGPLYEEFWGVELPPKKPLQSERFAERRAA